MWVALLYCMLLGARYANAVTNVKVAAYGQVFCDAAKSATPSRGTVKLYESDPVSDDSAEDLGPRWPRPEARLEGQNGRFEVAGKLFDGAYERYTEPYLLVRGKCGDRELQENYYLPCTNGDIFKDISVLLDGRDDNEVCD